MSQTSSPQRLVEKLTVQSVGDETLVYDERRHRAFCLNRTTSAVWKRCDGHHSVTQIAQAASVELQSPVSDELVLFALRMLQRDGLMQADSMPNADNSLSRRDLIQKLGASAVIVLPAIAALTVPRAAQALSGIVSGSRRGHGDSVPGPSRDPDSGSR